MEWTQIVVALVTIIPTTIVAAGAWITSRSNGKKVDGVHVIVNQQRADMTAKIEELMHRIAVLESEIAVNKALLSSPYYANRKKR